MKKGRKRSIDNGDFNADRFWCVDSFETFELAFKFIDDIPISVVLFIIICKWRFQLGSGFPPQRFNYFRIFQLSFKFIDDIPISVVLFIIICKWRFQLGSGFPPQRFNYFRIFQLSFKFINDMPLVIWVLLFTFVWIRNADFPTGFGFPK